MRSGFADHARTKCHTMNFEFNACGDQWEPCYSGCPEHPHLAEFKASSANGICTDGPTSVNDGPTNFWWKMTNLDMWTGPCGSWDEQGMIWIEGHNDLGSYEEHVRFCMDRCNEVQNCNTVFVYTNRQRCGLKGNRIGCVRKLWCNSTQNIIIICSVAAHQFIDRSIIVIRS
jgi:hypothetical protein